MWGKETHYSCIMYELLGIVYVIFNTESVSLVLFYTCSKMIKYSIIFNLI